MLQLPEYCELKRRWANGETAHSTTYLLSAQANNQPTNTKPQSLYMKTMLMTVTLNEWDLFWMAWMLFFCVANGAAVLSCVVFMIAHYHENDNDNHNGGEPTIKDTKNTSEAKAKTKASDELDATPSTNPRHETAAQSMTLYQDVSTICGKRKQRDEAFGMTSALSQGKWKQQKRRIVTVTQGPPVQTKRPTTSSSSSGRFSKTRAFSFGDASTFLRHAEQTVPLRRVVSCGDVKGSDLHLHQQYQQQQQQVSAAQYYYQTKPKNDQQQQQQQLTVLKQDQRSSMLQILTTQVRTFLVKKLQQAARNAVDEVLTSVFSFLTYAMLLFVMRQYSAVAIGVSLDLGAFSIEL